MVIKLNLLWDLKLKPGLISSYLSSLSWPFQSLFSPNLLLFQLKNFMHNCTICISFPVSFLVDRSVTFFLDLFLARVTLLLLLVCVSLPRVLVGQSRAVDGVLMTWQCQGLLLLLLLLPLACVHANGSSSAREYYYYYYCCYHGAQCAPRMCSYQLFALRDLKFC